MVVRVFAGGNGDRDLMLADDLVGQAHIVQIVHLDHNVIQALLGWAYPKGHGVVTLITVHKNWRNRLLAPLNLVFHAAAHAQGTIKAIGRIRILLTDNTVPQSARAGLEPAVHATSGIERLAELYLRSVENLDRIAVGVCEFQHLQHTALGGLVRRSQAVGDARFGQLLLHLPELLGPGNPKAQVAQIVARVVVQDNPMMPVVQARVAAVAFSFIRHFPANNIGRKMLPGVEVFDTNPYIAQLCDVNHCFLLRLKVGSNVFSSKNEIGNLTAFFV